MYTKQSIILKSDFYSRFGETQGAMYFEKTGFPCAILDSGSNSLLFSLGCGVRAYGRAYGDVLKVLNDNSNVCDVHFTDNGKGAQVLYSLDIEGIKDAEQTAKYTVNKLLFKMGSTERVEGNCGQAAVCDGFAPEGWAAYMEDGVAKSVPLPLNDYNVILIQTGRIAFSCDEDDILQFSSCERSRTEAAVAGLRNCRTDVFFEMVNESHESVCRILRPKGILSEVASYAMTADGIKACRICDIGIICFCERERTDTVVHFMKMSCSRKLGNGVRISVVK